MHRFKTLVILLGTIAAGCYIVGDGMKARVTQLHRSYDVLRPPPLSDLPPKLINVMTLGHKHIYDNFVVIWLLQALIENNLQAEPNAMMESIRSVIRTRPELESIYLLSCFVMNDDYQQPQDCQEITLAGLEVFPNSWRLPMMQGFIHNFKLDEPAQAAAFYQMAASRENSPAYVKGVVKKLLSKEGLKKDDLQKGLELLKNNPNASPYLQFIEQMQKLAQ